MKDDFYSARNLENLRTRFPEHFRRLADLAERTTEVWAALENVSSETGQSLAVKILDLMDACDEADAVFDRIGRDYRAAFGRPFFGKIDGFRKRRVRIRILLALHEDISRMKD